MDHSKFRMRRIDKNKMIGLWAFFLLASGLLLAKDPGINAFYKGDYKKAADYYEHRLDKDKENEKIMYNSGTTALAQKEYEKANSLLMQSLATKDKAQLAKAHYNLGQLAIQQQKTDEALEHFKKSMIYDPDDVNSKIMYEHLRQMQEQQQQDKNQDQGQGQDQDKNQESNSNNQDKDQDKKDQDKEQDQGQDQNEQQDKNQDQDQGQDQEQDQQQQDQQQQQSQLSEEDLQAQELTKEQAKNILNAMKEEEKESMKKLILSKAKSKRVKRSKEW